MLNQHTDDLIPALVPESDSIDPAELRQLWKLTEKLAPELWRKCYPRVYEEYRAGEYYSPKTAARQMLSTAMKVEMRMLGESEQYEIMWASHLAQFRVPMYWVTRDMVEAVRLTVPPVKLDWYNMPMPFPACVFMLPKGSLSHKTEGDARFISYNRNKAMEAIPTLARQGAKEWASTNGGMILFANTNAGYLTHWNIPYDHFPTVDLADLDNLLMQHEANVHSSGWLSTPNMTHDDTIFGASVAHLIFGLLLLIARKPSLVQVPALKKRIARAGKETREFWSPGVIGHNYKLRRVGVSKGGTHNSPRGHWVRGYFRDQRSGPGGQTIEEVWIEPYWRGGDEA